VFSTRPSDISPKKPEPLGLFYVGESARRFGFEVEYWDERHDSQKDLWGTGGPGYSFEDEIGATNKNNIGTIAMANSGPNTNGSQFFINVANNNFLDTKHTVFGKVVSGMDVVNAIQNTPTDANDRPTDPVVINSITIK